jgi:hypothetical protein
MKINAYTVLVEKPTGKKTLGKRGSRSEDIKIFWRVDPLLDNDRKISSNTTAVTK